MVKKIIYLLIVSLMLVSCDDSSTNLDTSDAKSYTGVLRVVSSSNARSEEGNILYLIKTKCGAENEGLAILSGDDLDLDGILEYEEALETGESSILCNGTDGQIVANTTDTENGQAHIFEECGNDNGLAFSVAYDTNNDGLLTGDEVWTNNYRVICETRNAIFSIDHSTYYSTLTVNSGQTETKVNFYYPVITEIDQNEENVCDGNGGFRIEMYNPTDRSLTPTSFDVNQTVCNGQDGVDGLTPTIDIIDKNGTETSNTQCEKTGGMKISLAGTDSYICNGEIGSFGGELNLSIRDDGTNVYIYDGNNKVSGALNLDHLNIASRETLVTKGVSNACPFGELNVTTYLDSNFNHILDSAEILSIESETICSAEVISAEALMIVSALIDSDTNLTIDFKFNRLVNQITVNQSSIVFICSSQSVKDRDVPIEIDYKVDLAVDGIKDFNLTYTQADLPQPTNDVDCQLKISKFIEDVNSVSMQTSEYKDFNFSVQ